MTTQEAMEILKPWIQGNGDLHNPMGWVFYVKGNDYITLDGAFDVEELEAISIYMRESKKEKE